MYRILSTSLLLAAGITISACNVTSSNVISLIPSNPFDSEDSHDNGSSNSVAPGSGTQLAASMPQNSGNANKSDSVSVPTPVSRSSVTNPDGSHTTTTQFSDGSTSTFTVTPISGNSNAAHRAAEQASRENTVADGKLDKDA